MTQARKHTLVEEEAVYHCTSRCVRRAFLQGIDPYTGKNYDHRKEWFRERLMLLVQIFTIEVLQYAIMSNHSHTLVRTRPDWLENMSDEEVVRRWFLLYPSADTRGKEPEKKELLDLHIQKRARDKKEVEIYRKRLGSVSWFMKSLNEEIAKMANKEDGCKGRFWEGRFHCQRVVGEAAMLSCAVYIDLNPVRAKVAESPEKSEYTSGYERILAIKKKREEELWIAPIKGNAQRRGFLSISAEEYLKILDESGRQVKRGKRGAISETLAPILLRLGVKEPSWADTITKVGCATSSVVGTESSLIQAAREQGKAWLKGMSFARKAFA